MTDTPQDFAETTVKRWLWRVILAVACIAAVVGWRVCRKIWPGDSVEENVSVAKVHYSPKDDRPTTEESATTAPQVDSEQGEADKPTPSVADEEPEPHRLIVGTWQDDYQGKRTMTLRPDGTGTMLVELSGINAMIFASRLTFEMVWSMEDGRLKKQTISGKPEGKVRAVLAMMGDKVEEEILELTDERLLVSDDKRQYDWRRVPAEP
jgi:hypothetical protein